MDELRREFRHTLVKIGLACCETLKAVSMVALYCVAVCLCELIFHYTIKGLEFITGFHLPESFHTLLSVLSFIVLGGFVVVISVVHMGGFLNDVRPKVTSTSVVYTGTPAVGRDSEAGPETP